MGLCFHYLHREGFIGARAIGGQRTTNMNKKTYQSLLNYSFRLLTRKAYTEYEILTRLKRRVKKFSIEGGEAAITKVMARLYELNYINDEKILDNFFLFSLPAKPQGKFGFLSTMRRRGIGREKAEQKWRMNVVSEKQLAVDLLARKSKQISKYKENKRKEKMARLLASRGFSGDTIWDVLGNE